MKNIKIYYKGGLDERLDNLIGEALSAKEYLFVGSGYDVVTKERDLEFRYEPLADSK